MDKYTDAFGNLQVPDDMADRILRAAEKDETAKPAAAPKKGKLTVLYRAAAGLAACLVLGLSLWLVKPAWSNAPAPSTSAVPTVGMTAPDESTAPTDSTVQPSAAASAPAGGKTNGATATVPAATAPAATIPAAETPAPDGDGQVTNPYDDLSSSAEFAAKLGYAPKLPRTLPDGFAESGAVLIGGKLAQVEYTDGTTTVTYRTAKGADDISGDYNSYSEQRTENGVTLRGDGGLVSLAVWNDGTYSYALSFSPGAAQQTALTWVGSVD